MRQQGLTTIELVVTLTVAALLITSGFQLYNIVNLRLGNNRMMAEASTIAQRYLRLNGGYAPRSNLCSSSPLSNPQTLTVSNTTLPGQTRVVIYRCKPFSSANIIRVTASVKYDSPEKEVVHATYVRP